MPKQEKTKDPIVAAVLVGVPEGLPVFVDTKSSFKTAAFQFVFPDGTGGIMTLTKKWKKPWQPSDDIKGVTINFTSTQ